MGVSDWLLLVLLTLSDKNFPIGRFSSVGTIGTDLLVKLEVRIT